MTSSSDLNFYYPEKSTLSYYNVECIAHSGLG